jgi:hypothetical protein
MHSTLHSLYFLIGNTQLLQVFSSIFTLIFLNPQHSLAVPTKNMFGWDSDLSDPNWGDWEDHNQYRYHQVSAIEGNVYPFDYHPFHQLSEAAAGYLKTQFEAPLYDSTHYNLIELATCVDTIQYEREVKFHRF